MSVDHPRIGRPLARRIDRLARSAHAFHRFAHHPLCERYEGEVLRIGRRTRVCRGCAYALLGSGVGALAGVILGTPLAALVSLILGASLGAWSLDLARLSRSSVPVTSAGRKSKLATRFVPAFAAAFALFGAIRSASPESLGIGVVVSASALVLVTIYRRRGPNRTPCASCPERNAPTTCSGLLPIVRREKAVMRKSGAMIRAELRGPPSAIHG